MLNTKLILIEGLPGAGKSTVSLNLGRFLQQQGLACKWFLEADDPHPIACLELKLKDLAHKLPPLWNAFSEQASRDPTVTIIESRLWQNTLLFMLMDEYPLDEIFDVYQLVCRELFSIFPVLIYLYQDDVETALKRLYKMRDIDSIEKDIKATSKYAWFQSRGLKDFDGWVQFFTEWQLVANRLYCDWPFNKTKVKNPHKDWEQAYQQIYRFLEIEKTH